MNCLRVYVLGAAIFMMAAGGLAANPLAAAPDQGLAAPAAYPERHEAPIVLGRSVGVRHKTKMHHVRLKPDEIFSDEAPSQND
ncbi:hypothetical protein [Methylocella silvestris]|uniref:Uncharacterized protein n=1 Tax=Methylocella silvestris TaxID=199596 RepID=A0A2J7TL55_METSI|nr:hypothetical protein [Methylocella silvestris]PNG27506.1 hypothetical protein CR492_00775 [Methylocella silvestris]